MPSILRSTLPLDKAEVFLPKFLVSDRDVVVLDFSANRSLLVFIMVAIILGGMVGVVLGFIKENLDLIKSRLN